MARRNITAGIDIGTHHVKVVVAEASRGRDRRFPKIIGVGMAESKGLRHGYIINSSDTVRSIRTAVAQAEKTAGVPIKKACLAVGGVSLEEYRATGEVIISRADAEVTDLDVEKVIQASEDRLNENQLLNKRILHRIPLAFRLDGQPVLGNRPQGLKGMKLEVDSLFIVCLEQHLNDLVNAVENAGVEVTDEMAAPIAASLVTLSKAQKLAGCILANIGSETVSLLVYEDNMPKSLKVFPIGSNDITNDIALGLQISLEEAEQVKTGAKRGDYPERKLENIINSRLSDIFELIEAHLKQIGKNGLLPAGVVLTGGGTGIGMIEDFARTSLKLPSRIAQLPVAGQNTGRIRDASWAVAYGLCIWGLTAPEETFGTQFSKKARGTLFSWIKQFLP